MKKTLLTVLVTLLVVGLAGGAVYVYQQHKPTSTVTVSQAIKERNEAVRVMNLHSAVDQANEAKLNERNADLQNRLTNVCTQVKAAKLPASPACN